MNSLPFRVGVRRVCLLTEAQLLGTLDSIIDRVKAHIFLGQIWRLTTECRTHSTLLLLCLVHASDKLAVLLYF